MNILIVHNYYQVPGGEDTVVNNEKHLLEANGHNVVLYTRNNSEIKNISKLKKILLPFSALFSMRTYFEVRQIIKEKNIDVVHVHNTLTLVSPSVYYSALSCKVPVVQTIHNFRLMCPGATLYRNGHICEDCVKKNIFCSIQHGCYRNSRAQTLFCAVNTIVHRMTRIYGKLNYICLTEFNKNKLLEINQIKPEKVFVKPNFVLNLDVPLCDRKRENQIVFVGRLDKLKGIDFLMEAWLEFERRYGDSIPELHIYGSGPMQEWCSKFIAEHDCTKIVMKGFVANTEVRKIIAKSKALVLPTQWYEGFPMTIVEAYSVGTPVVGTAMGNVGSLIENGVTGYTFILNNVESLIKSILKIDSIDNLEVKNMFERMYSQNINYQRLIEIYSKVVGRNI